MRRIQPITLAARLWLTGLGLAILAPLGSSAQAAQTAKVAEQTLVSASSEISFVAKQLGVPLNGRFKTFTAQLAFDPKQLQTSKVALQIDLGSVAVNADTDVELVKPEWFNTPKFPKALFQSSGIKATGPGKFDVTGKLSIKGQTRDLVVPVQLTQAQGLSTATGSLVIKRLDFKVGDGDWADPSVVANDVQVKFKLVLQGVPAL